MVTINFCLRKGSPIVPHNDSLYPLLVCLLMRSTHFHSHLHSHPLTHASPHIHSHLLAHTLAHSLALTHSTPHLPSHSPTPPLPSHSLTHTHTHLLQVFDVIVKHDASKFSYRQPPAPQFSIAMMHPGCNNLPRLDEVLDLSRAVAAAAAVPAAVELLAAAPVSLDAAAAAGGAAAQAAAVVSGSSSSRVSYRPVKFGLPEEGDVGFCELVPLRLMDLLTNM